MTNPRGRRSLDRWAELVMTSGLATVIATAGSFAIDRGKSTRDLEARRCEIVQAFLSDETPSPYMDAVVRQRVTQSAATAFDRCLREH